MNNLEPLKANLARAGIPARVSHRSFLGGRVSGTIVQMDILKNDKNKSEELRISVPDGDEAEVKVLGIDKSLNQAVVMVHEPANEFVEHVYDPKLGKNRDIVRKTPEEKRRFLVGMDECHLFIAQVTGGATSVKQAHDRLRPRNVPGGRAAKKRKIKRQGEWFFTPATVSEIKEIDEHIAIHGVEKNVRIGPRGRWMRGRPHVVTESVALNASRRIEGAKDVVFAQAQIEYVRGRIIHPDHHALHLDGWHRVDMNAENRSELDRFSNFVD
jgi:hypothetical protein